MYVAIGVVVCCKNSDCYCCVGNMYHGKFENGCEHGKDRIGKETSENEHIIETTARCQTV